MDWNGLKNFFILHGESLDRKAGRPGRGRFGTGKSAAFGIAERLRITSIRNGKRSRVELSRRDIQAISTGDQIPVKVIEREVATPQPNGTLVEIEGIQLRSLDQPGAIGYIERHLSRWPKNIVVFVNNHECEVAEPPVAWERKYRPSSDAAEKLGNVELVVKVSKAPLDEDLRGISIYSSGVWHATTLVTSQGREMSQYIFGEIDVPQLGEDETVPPPFDATRSMQLNVENELVRATYAFLGTAIEEVRRELVDAERRRKAGEEAKKLSKQAKSNRRCSWC